MIDKVECKGVVLISGQSWEYKLIEITAELSELQAEIHSLKSYSEAERPDQEQVSLAHSPKLDKWENNASVNYSQGSELEENHVSQKHNSYAGKYSCLMESSINLVNPRHFTPKAMLWD